MRLFGLITLALVAIAVIAITPVLWQNMKEPVVAKTNDGMSEGIKVHGDWEVKVTDPETGVEEVYAFRNELVNGVVLVSLLTGADLKGFGGNSGYYNPDNWVISAFNNANLMCRTLDTPATRDLSNLDSLGNSLSVLFSGVCTVPDGMSEFINVSAMAQYTKHDTGNEMQVAFTQKKLAAPISVQPGQIIAFNVSISFD